MGYDKQAWDKITASTKKLGADMGILDPDAQKKEQEMMDAILAETEGLTGPELQRLELENPEWLQDLVYRGADTTFQGDTNLGNISVDPRLKDTQMGALDSLAGIVDSGGMTAADEANLARIQSQSATADRGRRDAIKQNMAQRGMGGSGLELLQQLQSNQAATDRQAQGGLDVAGMAQDRALEAMMQGGQLAGNIRGQDFGEQERVYSAQDAIDKFNTGNQNTMSRFNTGNEFRADQYNTSGRQRVADQGVMNNNRANTYNTTALPQRNWDNEMDIFDRKNNAKVGKMNQISAQSKENTGEAKDFWGNVVRAGTAAATGGGSEVALAASGGAPTKRTTAGSSEEDDYQYMA